MVRRLRYACPCGCANGVVVVTLVEAPGGHFDVMRGGEVRLPLYCFHGRSDLS